MIGINGIIVTDKMAEVGNRIASDLLTATAMKCLGNSRLGGCKPFDISNFKDDKDLIQKYVDEDIDSVTAIYLAMERTK